MKIVLTLTGPSASGKSYLERLLVSRGFANIISHTTRAPRAGEVDGINYHFVSKKEFEAMDERGEFVESVNFGGSNYGGSSTEFEKCFSLEQPVVVVCEPIGRDQIIEAGARKGWHVIPVYVEAPYDVTAERMVQRLFDDMEGKGNVVREVSAFTKRLTMALSTEQGWREEARKTFCPYDFIFFRFDKEVEQEIATILFNAVVRLKVLGK